VASAIRLMLLTGARRGEVLQARWDEIDLERGVWTKPSHKTKERKTEHVPLSPAALALLRALQPSALSEHVFPGRRSGQPLVEVKKAWAAIRQAAGLGEARLHDLRHTFASHLVSRGISLHVVGRLLGHSQPRTTMRYAHIADQALRDATTQFGELVESVGKGRSAEVIPLPSVTSS
jgi:integrase